MTKYYRVRTQGQYDWLTTISEIKGIKWFNGNFATQWNGFSLFGSHTVIVLDHEKNKLFLHDEAYFSETDFIEVSDLMEM